MRKAPVAGPGPFFVAGSVYRAGALTLAVSPGADAVGWPVAVVGASAVGETSLKVCASAAFQGDAATPPAADAPTTATGQPTRPPTGEAPNVNAPTS